MVVVNVVQLRMEKENVLIQRIFPSSLTTFTCTTAPKLSMCVFVRTRGLVTPLLMQWCFCLLVPVPPDPPRGVEYLMIRERRDVPCGV